MSLKIIPCNRSATYPAAREFPQVFTEVLSQAKKPIITLEFVEIAGLEKHSIPTEVKRFFLYLVWFPDSLY